MTTTYHRDRGTLRPRIVRNDGSMVFNWGEVGFRSRGPALHLSQYDDHGHTLVVGLIFLTLYIKTRRLFTGWECMEDGLGFSFTSDGLHMYFGRTTKIWWYPWDWTFHKRWEAVEFDSLKDGRWTRGQLAFVELPRMLSHGVVGTKWVHDYTYKLRSGEIQHRKATIYVDRMEWRWRWLKLLPWPRLVRTSINVSFDGEVGEGTGSYKGGTIGCGYDMKPGETPLETLRRMEREREFKR